MKRWLHVWLPAALMSTVLIASSAPLGAAVPVTATPALVSAARDQTMSRVIYDGSYVQLAYPMGDVPADRGVCTDVVIRAYRTLGIDLQVLVHEDMRANFTLYPRNWGLSRPDRNIDHRRVPNLQKFLDRAGARIEDVSSAAAFMPGDLVTWLLPGNLPHIGIVSDRRQAGSDRPLIIHNIGAGPVEDDILFSYPVTGHFRFKVQ